MSKKPVQKMTSQNNSISKDLKKIALQESRLQFEHFDVNTAWEIGSRLRQLAELAAFPIVIDVQLHNRQVFFSALPGSAPGNAEWVRRKQNVVLRFHQSSYAVGLGLTRDNMTIEQHGVATADFAPHGGCFPILLRGTGCVGSIAVSGLPQRQDHELIVAVLSEFLGQTGLALSK